MPKYNVTSVGIMETTISEWIAQSESTLDNEESKDYPSDDRVDSLTERIDALTEAMEALGSIE
jgi:hypothetical protein